jgi:phosphatidylserine/phosphatidylglycerophosphate/cardiolipin synthase-like enzyme
MSKLLSKKVATLQHDLTMESAYFVILDKGVGNAKLLKEKGVKVRVLTNSLASNDVVAAHAGLYVESPELAAQVLEYMDEGVQPDNSYGVLLDESGDLVWVTEVNGEEVRYDDEPETTFGQRFMSDFISILPVEHQL